MQNHHYSLTEINEMMPWERDIYLTMLIEHIKSQNEEMERRQRSNGR